MSALGQRRHVRFGSKADIRAAKGHVCFTPESGHLQCNSSCLLWAKSGLTRCSKRLDGFEAGNLTACGAG
jgi:hypothetical protein